VYSFSVDAAARPSARILVHVRTCGWRLGFTVVAAALSACCHRTPPTTRSYPLPSGKRLHVIACDVTQDEEGRWLGALRYRTGSSDSSRREAEAVAIVGEIGPQAERANIQALYFLTQFPSWGIQSSHGGWPTLRRESRWSYSFVLCDDGRWARYGACISTPRAPHAFALNPQVTRAFCGSHGEFSLAPPVRIIS
jgi:hypothetical protein